MMLTTGRLGQIHFALEGQRTMIVGHGTQVVVFPTVTCACLTLDGTPDPNDPACGGTGRFRVPGAEYTTTLLLQDDHSMRAYLEPGTWIGGTVKVTTLPGVVLGDRDQIRLLDLVALFDEEVLIRGVHDTLRFSAGVQVQFVTDRQTVYVAGRDYQLTPPNTITWLPGGYGPAMGAFYSIRYLAHPDYLVFAGLPRLRVEHGVTQSQVVTLRRLDHLTLEVP